MIPPQITLLPDGKRLHLQQGPIDLVIEARGELEAVRSAYRQAAAAFTPLLTSLCDELNVLRQPTRAATRFTYPVAHAMQEATLAFAAGEGDEPYRAFITPMAAVAGAVADHILSAAWGQGLTLLAVNNGGDIALRLREGECFTLGMVDNPELPRLFGRIALDEAGGIGGIATSGWRGRSFSRGIADAVTVLARTAAEADAAATIIANAVDLPGHRGVQRVAACSIQPDSDLGDILVTRAVPVLSRFEAGEALARGVSIAESLRSDGLIVGAALHLQGQTRVVEKNIHNTSNICIQTPEMAA